MPRANRWAKPKTMLKATTASGLLAKIKRTFPEGILRETAITYADVVGGWEIGRKIRRLEWEGIWTDAETFLKQAEIVGEYNNFGADVAKKIVEAYAGKEFRLGREGGILIYVRPIDGDNLIPSEEHPFWATDWGKEDDALWFWWD